MKYGLRESDLLFLKKVFEQQNNIEEVILFGSRAMGNHKPGSDVDLAFIGKNLSLIDLAGSLNESSPLPYHFDIIHYDQAPLNLRSHIDRVGITIYKKSIITR